MPPPAYGREYIRWTRVIDIAKLGVGREDYYLREVAKDRGISDRPRRGAGTLVRRFGE